VDNKCVAVPIDRDVPDLTGWLAFCPTCGHDREVRRVRERDAHTGAEYFAFVCIFCHSTLLNFHRSGVEALA